MVSTTITIKVPPEIRLAFKLAAMKQNKTMTDILLETIKQFIKESKKNETK
jgi:predicted transcriptional regulator